MKNATQQNVTEKNDTQRNDTQQNVTQRIDTQKMMLRHRRSAVDNHQKYPQKNDT